jgi:nicotinate phosphoribosyltransferase
MPPRRRKRLDPAVFGLPVDQIRAGFFSDIHAERMRSLLRQEKKPSHIVLQVTGKSTAYLGGIDEALAVLRLGVDDWSALAVHALYEGDWYDDWDTVMTIEGPYDAFAHLETVYLGVLARRTRVCTNARHATEAARPKPVLSFGARRDHYLAQPGDGYSAYVGGVTMVSSPGQASLFNGKTMCVVPHAMIAMSGGNSSRAARLFAETFAEANDIIVSVSYHNDCVKTSLDVARALEGRLWGVRVDTSENLVDKSVVPQMGSFRPTGVSPQLVWNVRNALDSEGFGDVKVVVSGGFDADRIRLFEEDGVPVDAYEIGAALHGGRFDFTADVVQVDGKNQSRAGRELRPNAKLERVK